MMAYEVRRAKQRLLALSLSREIRQLAKEFRHGRLVLVVFAGELFSMLAKNYVPFYLPGKVFLERVSRRILGYQSLVPFAPRFDRIVRTFLTLTANLVLLEIDGARLHKTERDVIRMLLFEDLKYTIFAPSWRAYHRYTIERPAEAYDAPTPTTDIPLQEEEELFLRYGVRARDFDRFIAAADGAEEETGICEAYSCRGGSGATD